MKLLTKVEADTLVCKANEEVLKSGKFYRYGQALWYLLPKEIRDKFVGTSVDFFYEGDNEKVVAMFYDNYVDKPEDKILIYIVNGRLRYEYKDKVYGFSFSNPDEKHCRRIIANLDVVPFPDSYGVLLSGDKNKYLVGHYTEKEGMIIY